MPCEMQGMFTEALDDNLRDVFDQLSNYPDVSLRVNFLLKPLFEQLLRLRMAELANPAVYAGKSINPILKEIRQTIIAIDRVLSETLKDYRVTKPEKSITSKSYYDMLLSDGVSSVETRVGVSD